MNMPHLRYVAFSYSDTITTRDNNKMVRLVSSPSYRQLWGDRFFMVKTGELRIENNMTGFKLATTTRSRFLRTELANILAKRSDVLSPRMVRIIEELAGDWHWTSASKAYPPTSKPWPIRTRLAGD
jgi:hypothetical protein